MGVILSYIVGVGGGLMIMMMLVIRQGRGSYDRGEPAVTP